MPQDRVAPVNEVISVIDKVKTQKGVKIEHATIKGANHFSPYTGPLFEQVVAKQTAFFLKNL